MIDPDPIDESGKYAFRSANLPGGSVHRMPDGIHWSVKDPDGQDVTELGALVIFDSPFKAAVFLRGRNL